MDMNNNFDDLFADKFRDFEAPPPQKMWSEIKSSLDNEQIDETFKKGLASFEANPSARVWQYISQRLPLNPLLSKTLSMLSGIAAVLVVSMLATYVYNDWQERRQAKQDQQLQLSNTNSTAQNSTNPKVYGSSNGIGTYGQNPAQSGSKGRDAGKNNAAAYNQNHIEADGGLGSISKLGAPNSMGASVYNLDARNAYLYDLLVRQQHKLNSHLNFNELLSIKQDKGSLYASLSVASLRQQWAQEIAELEAKHSAQVFALLNQASKGLYNAKTEVAKAMAAAGIFNNGADSRYWFKAIDDWAMIFDEDGQVLAPKLQSTSLPNDANLMGEIWFVPSVPGLLDENGSPIPAYIVGLNSDADIKTPVINKNATVTTNWYLYANAQTGFSSLNMPEVNGLLNNNLSASDAKLSNGNLISLGLGYRLTPQSSLNTGIQYAFFNQNIDVYSEGNPTPGKGSLHTQYLIIPINYRRDLFGLGITKSTTIFGEVGLQYAQRIKAMYKGASESLVQPALAASPKSEIGMNLGIGIQKNINSRMSIYAMVNGMFNTPTAQFNQTFNSNLPSNRSLLGLRLGIIYRVGKDIP